jgi:hypothetical protein
VNRIEQGHTTCRHNAEIFVLNLAIRKVTTRFFQGFGERVTKYRRHYYCCKAERRTNFQAIFVERIFHVRKEK